MAAIREVVIGGVAAELQSFVMAHLVAETRRHALERCRTYNHKRPALHTVPFDEIYSEDKETRQQAIGKATLSMDAVVPEEGLYWNSVERVIVLTDDNPNSEPERYRPVSGIVMVRPSHGKLRRFNVVLKWWIASNGNVNFLPESSEIWEDRRKADEVASTSAPAP